MTGIGPAGLLSVFGSSGVDVSAGDTMDDRPLIITDDELVLDDLLRLAAAAGVEVTHAREPDSRGLWRSAPLVLIDAGLVPRAVSARLPRRSGVVMVAAAEPGSDLWALCVRLGVDRTAVLDRSEELLIGLLSDAVAGGSGNGLCLAVLGACGGAGASVFAGALGLTAARTAEVGGGGVLLIDCDPWGAGLDVLLGIEGVTGLRWVDLAARSGRLPVDALQQALPEVRVGAGRLGVLCHGRRPDGEISAEVMDVVLDAGRRSGALTIVDLPRYPGPAADRVLEQADLTVLLAPADVRGCWAADRVCGRIREFGSRAGVVVRGPSPGGMGADEVAQFLDLPLLARMRPVSSLPRELEIGLAVGADRRRPLARAAREVLLALREAA
jgi:secretion/DNA translocation related CpaE-like protein